jgi:hypothetical protein
MIFKLHPIQYVPNQPYGILNRSQKDLQNGSNYGSYKFIRDSMNIDDIAGARSRRVVREQNMNHIKLRDKLHSLSKNNGLLNPRSKAATLIINTNLTPKAPTLMINTNLTPKVPLTSLKSSTNLISKAHPNSLISNTNLGSRVSLSPLKTYTNAALKAPISPLKINTNQNHIGQHKKRSEQNSNPNQQAKIYLCSTTGNNAKINNKHRSISKLT